MNIPLNIKTNKSKGGLLESRFEGLLLNTNTAEEYTSLDIDSKLIELFSEDFRKKVLGEEWMENPEILNKFLLLSFADLKKYVYQYSYNSLVIDDSIFQVNVTKSKLLHKEYKKNKDTLKKILDTFLIFISEKEQEKSYNSPFIVY